MEADAFGIDAREADLFERLRRSVSASPGEEAALSFVVDWPGDEVIAGAG